MTTTFIILPRETWVLSKSIKHSRRLQLLNPPTFEEIVAGLVTSVQLATVRRERGKFDLARWRVRACISVPPDSPFVDLFHNSAAGLRAQCLSDARRGNTALDLSRDMLRYRAIQLMKDRRHLRLPLETIVRSIGLADCKLWIHQGQWIRYARTDDRHILIDSWNAHRLDAPKEIRNLVRYGSKAPSGELTIEVIGGWLDQHGHPLKGKPPGSRAQQIHDYGFT